MTILDPTRIDPTRLADAFRRAAVRATLAPSVHNTQPWQLRLGPDRLALYADRDRQLTVHDPTGRQLTISCGSALFNARTSLAADGVPVSVRRFPAGVAAREACAVITVDDTAVDDGALALLDKSVESRHTNTGPFTHEQVPGSLVDQLRTAASVEGVRLMVLDPGEAGLVWSRHRRAATVMQLDPAYRAELRAWRGADPETPTGGHPGGSTDRTAPGPERLALIITDHDHPTEWLRAGEALERVLLEATRSGYAVGLSSQIAEVPSVRTELRRSLRIDGYPHVLLRIGVAPASPATRRRRFGEVITPDL